MSVLGRSQRMGWWLTIMVLAAGMISSLALSGPALAEDDVYRIGPSDILEITVWREQEVTRPDLLVRPDGRISMLLVDDIMAAGLTPMELKAKLTTALSQFLENPKVYVNVREARSQTFSFLGNVLQPGVFPIMKPTTVLQALALAGGFNEWAKRDDIVIIRGHGKYARRFPFEYSEVVAGNKDKVNQNILLEPGDVIVVP